jgi:hypothetical protein
MCIQIICQISDTHSVQLCTALLDFTRRFSAEITVTLVRTGLYIYLSVGVTCNACFLEIEGLFTQESQPGQIWRDSIGGNFALDNSDWSNGLR